MLPMLAPPGAFPSWQVCSRGPPALPAPPIEQDLPGALSDAQVAEGLGLTSIKSRDWSIFKTSGARLGGHAPRWLAAMACQAPQHSERGAPRHAARMLGWLATVLRGSALALYWLANSPFWLGPKPV